MTKQVIFDKKNVLVAGGAGFIGSHLCDELVKTCKVICVDNFISGSERNIDHLLSNPNFIFINHDLAQPLDFSKIPELENFKIEFQGLQEIYNLACPMSPHKFLENRSAILLANSYVVKNLLDLAVQYQSSFLQFSSSVIYGPRREDQPDLKMKESDLGMVDHLSARGVYDEGKRFAETMVSSYRDFYGIDTKIIRLFRVYGPRMELNNNHMIPDFINNALDNNDITIFGNESFSSSFCYIDDVIDAVMKMMDTNNEGPINIGSDVNIRFIDLVNLIIQETGSQSKVSYSDNQVFMTELILPDIYKAKTELNWMPVVTLDNGIKKTIFDIKANKRLHQLDD